MLPSVPFYSVLALNIVLLGDAVSEWVIPE